MVMWESAPVQVTSEGLSSLSLAQQGALGAWKLFLEDGTTKSQCGCFSSHFRLQAAGVMWDPQQELLQPTPHLSHPKIPTAGSSLDVGSGEASMLQPALI